MAFNYKTLDTTTREVWRKRISDGVFDKSALLKMLLMDERVIEKGGTKIFEPVRHSKSTSGGAYPRGGTFDISDQDTLTKAEFDWAFYYANVTIFGQDMAINDGDRAMLDLQATKMEDAELKLRDDISNDIYSGTTDIIGLGTAIAASGTYGGISPSDMPTWVSGVDSTSYTTAQLLTESDPSTYIKDLFAKAVRNATHFGMKPNAIIVPLFIWDVYESALETNARYPKGKRAENIASAGFQTLMFRNIPVIADEMCPDKEVYVLNTEAMALNVLDKKNFHWSGFKEATNGDYIAGQFTLGTQLTIRNRRLFYKFTGFPTS